MNLLDGLKKNNIVKNTKGSNYYNTTYNNNLDVFTMLSRFNSEEDIIRIFNNALLEDKTTALANLLYILDIRNGKGERRIFKVIFKDLCINHSSDALRILPFISSLGRFDYILEGIDTPIEEEVLKLIENQLMLDTSSKYPSLLAKWLPSHRCHGKNNMIAKKIMKYLNMTEKEYRTTLSDLRGKLNIIEKNLSNKDYDSIRFESVPTKAMLKYNRVFNSKMNDRYIDYLANVSKGNTNINTSGLFVYEVINKILYGNNTDDMLCDLMWKNQKDVLNGCNTNVLVMADTSGSMTCNNCIPLCTSIGLALYTAERNTGIFKDHFITFSSHPTLCEVKGETIKDKLLNIRSIVSNTDIDKAFELILNTAIDNKLSSEDLPSHLLIISDMEFDTGVYSSGGTNLEGWRRAFKDKGYNLPIIIFWNVAGNTNGVPTTKFDNDVCMISGFSTNILDNLLSLDSYSPIDVMMDSLKTYIELLGN